MNEARQTLKALEQSVKLLQQQQNTFIKALDRTRENAHDRIGPVRTLAQVQNYIDSHCNNRTDKRILTLFLDVCADLAEFCIQLKSMQKTTHSEKGIVEQTIALLNPTNDLSGLTARYPHNVLNLLSCNEAHNYYAGVVSIVPIVLDNIREAVLRLESARTLAEDRPVAIQKNTQKQRKAEKQDAVHNRGVQTTPRQGNASLIEVKGRRKAYLRSFNPARKAPGRYYST